MILNIWFPTEKKLWSIWQAWSPKDCSTLADQWSEPAGLALFLIFQEYLRLFPRTEFQTYRCRYKCSWHGNIAKNIHVWNLIAVILQLQLPWMYSFPKSDKDQDRSNNKDKGEMTKIKARCDHCLVQLQDHFSSL